MFAFSCVIAAAAAAVVVVVVVVVVVAAAAAVVTVAFLGFRNYRENVSPVCVFGREMGFDLMYVIFASLWHAVSPLRRPEINQHLTITTD